MHVLRERAVDVEQAEVPKNASIMPTQLAAGMGRVNRRGSRRG